MMELASLRLSEQEYVVRVRQRIVAIWAYKEVFKQDFKFEKNLVEPEVVHCYVKEEAPNFLLTNYWGDYYAGICLEQQKHVEAILPKVNSAELHKLLQKLPEGYVAEFAYIDTYKPKEVS